MLSDVIHARALARTFRKKKQEVHAVVGVDLDVEAGEIVGFLGPNGAGKTTTLRMLTTLLEPTAGTATVAGRDLVADPVGVRRRIGYVSQSGSTAPEARAGEEVVDHARLYGMGTAEATARGQRLFAELDLEGGCGSASPRRCPVASAVGSTSRWASCTSPDCSSSTSR